MNRRGKVNSASLMSNDKALSTQQDSHVAEAVMPELWSQIAQDYVKEVAAQTRGSYRAKRANKLGKQLMIYLKMIAGTPGEQSIVGYVERAQTRLLLAKKCQRKDSNQDDRGVMVFLLFERLALETLLELDKMEALGAIHRVRRCARCKSWLWGRVKNQRYCTEKCRVRHYHTSGDGKRYKREWARKAYHAEKRRIEEEKRQFVKRSARIR
jgi:hypothetical protein